MCYGGDNGCGVNGNVVLMVICVGVSNLMVMMDVIICAIMGCYNKSKGYSVNGAYYSGGNDVDGCGVNNGYFVIMTVVVNG